ncbi:MAG: ABC transporter ATP-binding protein [Sediminispirochaetaceae bacterium]
MKNNGAPLLLARDIVMQFGGLKALNGVEVEAKSDEILGLIGPNGSGKTTFFNVSTGIYTPTSGSIEFKGENIVGKSCQDIAKMGIIRTFQTSRLWFDMSIIDNVLLGMFMRENPGLLTAVFRPRSLMNDFSEKIEEAKEVLSIFDPELASNCYRKARDLSLVDRRRVEICRAIVAEPVLLLLDEPAAGMDVSETQELMNDIEKLKEERGDIGVIVIEHDMMVISSIAQRVIVFNFGKKIAEGSYSEIKSNTEVREAYLGKS